MSHVVEDTDLTPGPSPIPPDAGRVALVIIAAILSLAGFTYLGHVFEPVLIAIFLYFIIKPAADWFVRRGLSEWVAYLVLFVVVLLLCVLLTQLVYSQAVEFRGRIDEYRDQLLDLAAKWSGMDRAKLQEMAFTELFQVSTSVVVGYSFSVAATFLELFLMVTFYLLFVILDARDVPGRIRRAFHRDTAEHLLHVGRSIIDGITGYMRIKTLVGLGMGASAGLILWLFDVRYWELWAFLTFMLNYVTYIGSLLILVPPIVVAFAELSPGAATLVSLLLCVNRVLWIDYVEIHHSGRQLNINSILILMSLAYWGWFWGVIGLILAVPMLTAAHIVLSNFEGTKRLAVLMAED